MFTEDELRQLEHGYSVSDTDADEMLSLRSGASAGLGSINSPLTEDYHHHRGQQPIMLDEQRIRHTAERSMLHAEIAKEKSKYLKKVSNLERIQDRLKDEKRQLQMLIESERQNFRMQMMQQEQKTTEQLRDLKDQQYKLQG